VKRLGVKAGSYGEQARKNIATVRRYATAQAKKAAGIRNATHGSPKQSTVDLAIYESWQDACRAARYALEVIGREDGK
jgi:hypothetical protein